MFYAIIAFIFVERLNIKVMKTRVVLVGLFLGIYLFSNAQTEFKSTIATATPSVQGLTTTPSIINKIINLELIQLNQYSVYDEFDIAEVINSNPKFKTNCYGLSCLTELGTTLKVDYVMSGSIDKLGQKIIISLKIVDVKQASIHKTIFKEFTNQENELQRMIEITLREMFGLDNIKEVEALLSYKNEMITSSNIGRINNSGPRIGYAAAVGTLLEFAARPEIQGGLNVFPAFSMLGYQFEKQYIGTENFAALFECIVNVSGLEQGLFIPTVSFMNGFRFGKAGWEIAFGPSIGISKRSIGFFDSKNLYGKGENYYWTSAEYNNYRYNQMEPGANEPFIEAEYPLIRNLDTRGATYLSTRWLMAFGRTFKSGALSIPVNVFYSSSKGGGMAGVSVGFNIIQKKETIN
jgi:hypothetical protein